MLSLPPAAIDFDNPASRQQAANAGAGTGLRRKIIPSGARRVACRIARFRSREWPDSAHLARWRVPNQGSACRTDCRRSASGAGTTRLAPHRTSVTRAPRSIELVETGPSRMPPCSVVDPSGHRPGRIGRRRSELAPLYNRRFPHNALHRVQIVEPASVLDVVYPSPS